MRTRLWTIALLALTVCPGSVSAARADGDAATVVFADTVNPTAMAARVWDAGSWTAPVTGAPASGRPTWEKLARCGRRDEVASLTVTDNRRVQLRLWDGSAWGSTTTLTNDCGTSGRQVCAAAYEGVSGRLLVAYRRNSQKQVYFRYYDSPSPAEQAFAMSLNGAPLWMSLTACPDKNEIVLLVKTDKRLYGAVWNGASFTNQITLDTSMSKSRSAIAAAYMRGSGQALVVWAASSKGPKSRVWSGTAWQAEAAPAAPNKSVGWIAAAASPAMASNDVLVAWIDSNKDITACRWNGSAWGTGLVVENNVVSYTQQRADLAYQPDGARALLLWHRSGDQLLHFRYWNGTSWGLEQLGPDMNSETTTIRLGAGSDPDKIVMAALRKTSAPVVTDYVLYSKSMFVATGTAEIGGPVGNRVAGVTGPTPPPAAAGSTNLVYGDDAIAALTPGAYGSLTAGNNCTLTLGAGTYVFSSVALGNGVSLSADTSGGDVHIIVTGGGWTAGDGMTLAPLDESEPGYIFVDVNTGAFTLGDNAVISAWTINVHSGRATIRDNADIVALIYADDRISVTSGVIDPSMALSPGGRLIGLGWTAGSAGVVTTLCSSIQGGAGGYDLAGSPPPRLRVTRWREVGPGQ